MISNLMLGNNKYEVGHLDRRIDVEDSTDSTDAVTGAEVPVWDLGFRIWAKQYQKRTMSNMEAKQEVEVKSFDYITRYSPDTASIDHTMRIIDDEEEFYVTGTEKMKREGYVIVHTEKRE